MLMAFSQFSYTTSYPFVARSSVTESTSFGAALMAGSAEGVDVFLVSPDRTKCDVTFSIPTTIFKPSMDDNGNTMMNFKI